MTEKRGEKGQVTIFIILGLLLLLVLILLFTRGNLTSFFAPKGVVSQVEECVKGPVEEGISILTEQGGSIDPQNYYLYQNKKIDYICYTNEYYKGCVMQKPLLVSSIKSELKEYSEPRIKNCLSVLKGDLERGGYEVRMKEPNITLDLIPDNLIVDLDLDLSVTKDGTESFNNIRVGQETKLYNSVLIASSIGAWETNYGDSETLNYMLYYPSIKVEKKKRSEGTTIYIITDRASDEKFYFAVRSYVMPPGAFEFGQ